MQMIYGNHHSSGRTIGEKPASQRNLFDNITIYPSGDTARSTVHQTAKICVRINVGFPEISLPCLKNEIHQRVELILCERLYDIPPHHILGCRKVSLVNCLAFTLGYGPVSKVRKLRLACNAMPIANRVISRASRAARVIYVGAEATFPLLFHFLLPRGVRSHLRKCTRSIGRLRSFSGRIRWRAIRCAERRWLDAGQWLSGRKWLESVPCIRPLLGGNGGQTTVRIEY